MTIVKQAALCALFFGSGALAAISLEPANAHNTLLTRFDVERAVRDVMRGEAKQSVSTTDIQETIRAALSRCRFKGQYSQRTAQEDDMTDFVGQVSC